MARIAGIDIPRNKKVSYSLRYIFGIGLTQAKNICDKAGVDQNIIVQNLSADQVVSIRTAMTDLQVTVEGELRSEVAMNIKRLKDVGSYRGLRHRKGLPVNGQRTNKKREKTNCRYGQDNCRKERIINWLNNQNQEKEKRRKKGVLSRRALLILKRLLITLILL